MVFGWFTGDPYSSFTSSIKRLKEYEKKLFDVLDKEEIKEIKKHTNNVIKQFEDLEQKFEMMKGDLQDLQTQHQQKLRVDVYGLLEESIEKLSKSIKELRDKKEELIKYWDSESFKEDKYHELFLELIELVKTELKEIDFAKEYVKELKKHKKEPKVEITYFPKVLVSKTFRGKLKERRLLTEYVIGELNETLEHIHDREWVNDNHPAPFNATDLWGVHHHYQGPGRVFKVLYYIKKNIIYVCNFFTNHQVYVRVANAKHKNEYEEFRRISSPVT